MKANLQSKISDPQVKSFFNDGVVLLRNVFDSEWISLLKKGIAKNLSEPSEGSRIWDRNRKGGLISMSRIIGAELKSTEICL